MGVKAVFFDMDGTLVRIPISIAQFLSNVYREPGLHFTVDQISVAREKVSKWWNEEFPDYTLWTREAFIESNHRLLTTLGAEGDLGRLSEEVQSYWDNLPEEAGEEVYPEVDGVLKELGEEKVILGVLSNRLQYLRLRSLEKHGIREYFRLVISPQIAGAPKGRKGPEMWKFALNKIRARPKEILHVDNEYEDGVLAPRSVGMQSVLVDRKGTHTHITDCAVVRDLTGIFDLLREP